MAAHKNRKPTTHQATSPEKTSCGPETPPSDGGLIEALERLQNLANATGARLVRSPAPGCSADCQGSVYAGGDFTMRETRTGCRPLARAQAQLLLSTPVQDGDKSRRLACTCCRLSDGGELGLQLVFSNAGPGAIPERSVVLEAAVPVLMWARQWLERMEVEARVAAVEERSRSDLLMALRAHEEEREWLSLEVHDRVAQTLASVFQQLQTLESLCRSLPKIRQVAVRGSVLCREAIREARNIMNELRPPILDEMGLIPLVEEELDRFERETGRRVTRKLVSTERPPRDTEVALYRIFHEACINIRRHAEAKEVTVSLECDHDGVQLQVEDDGAGFDVHKALVKKRIGGLVSMQRRAELAGGTCRLESQIGKGSRVSVWIPSG